VPVLVSVHDVMPETLPAVEQVVAMLEGQGWRRILLLVVPGRAWRDADIDRLHAWQGAGHRLAGHGWTHRVDPRALRRPSARLHSLLISRDVAEHLALDAEGILALLRRCHRWFGEQGLATPDYYVPPAWAMGPIAPHRLATSPFDEIEYLGGIYDVRANRFLRLPLVGFEADTRLRALSLRLWNGLNRRLTHVGTPLRIAIHPHDTRLQLAGDLLHYLVRYRPPVAATPRSRAASKP